MSSESLKNLINTWPSVGSTPSSSSISSDVDSHIEERPSRLGIGAKPKNAVAAAAGGIGQSLTQIRIEKRLKKSNSLASSSSSSSSSVSSSISAPATGSAVKITEDDIESRTSGLSEKTTKKRSFESLQAQLTSQVNDIQSKKDKNKLRKKRRKEKEKLNKQQNAHTEKNGTAQTQTAQQDETNDIEDSHDDNDNMDTESTTAPPTSSKLSSKANPGNGVSQFNESNAALPNPSSTTVPVSSDSSSTAASSTPSIPSGLTKKRRWKTRVVDVAIPVPESVSALPKSAEITIEQAIENQSQLQTDQQNKTRKRTKTRSRQKNMRKDTRPQHLKPTYLNKKSEDPTNRKDDGKLAASRAI